jgi:hypothetical protein
MPRCPEAMPECATRSLEMYTVDDAEVRCLLYDGQSHQPPVGETA